MSKNAIPLFRFLQRVYGLIIIDAELDDQPIEPGDCHPLGVQFFQQRTQFLSTREADGSSWEAALSCCDSSQRGMPQRRRMVCTMEAVTTHRR